MQGSFGTWTVVRGSPPDRGTTGEDITLNIPITSGTLTIGATALPLVACVATATIRASYIPQPGAATRHQLVATQTATDPATVDASAPSQSTFLRQQVLIGLQQQWLQDNLGLFNRVFAVVDLQADFSKQPGLSWMSPTYLGYATAEPTQLPGQPAVKNIFAVLALIDGAAPSPQIVNAVSPFIIPSGADAGMAIAPEMFLKHFMLPGAPYMFDGTPDTATSFEVDNDDLQITSTADLQLNKLSLDSGKIVSPSVPKGAFSIQVNGTQLSINVDKADYSPSTGFEASLWYKGIYTISLDTKNRVLSLNDISHQAGGSCAATKGYEVAMIVLGVVSGVLAIVGGVAGAVAKAATASVNAAAETAEISEAATSIASTTTQEQEAAANATISCCRGLISGTPQSLSNLATTLKVVAKIAVISGAATGLASGLMGVSMAVINGDYSSQPKLDDLVEMAVGKVIQWPSTVDSLTLVSAQLNGCLQLGLKHGS